jgi:lipoprotein-anchoring transpeptidase ErfK/SrfK
MDAVNIALATTDKDKSIGKVSKFNNILAGLLIVILSFILFFAILIYAIPPLTELVMKVNGFAPPSSEIFSPTPKDYAKIKLLTGKMQQKYVALTPPRPYIVVNTTYNRFKLYKNRRLIREGFCSTGSYTLLKSHFNREWIFQTPKGFYRIQGKITNPVWRRPDWSFVEEGLPIPSQNDPSRWEAGVLGDYAMSIGDGYLIHGTIYKRFLGMPVTHGCIRMNDDDLEAVYKTLELGSKVYIY